MNLPEARSVCYRRILRIQLGLTETRWYRSVLDTAKLIDWRLIGRQRVHYASEGRVQNVMRDNSLFFNRARWHVHHCYKLKHEDATGQGYCKMGMVMSLKLKWCKAQVLGLLEEWYRGRVGY